MIDTSAAMPLYHQVAGVLRQRIEDGTYPVGAQLQPEDELAAEFGVSRATLRQALAELVMEGMVVRRQGRGTFVEPRNEKVLQQRYRGSLGDLIRESHRARFRDLEILHDETLPGYVSEVLRLDEPKGTIVRRTRTMDGEPFAYTATYLPPHLGRKLTKQSLRRKALMEVLIDDGTVLASATQSVRAQLADMDMCGKLDVEIGAAVLYVERLVNDDEGQPVQFVRSWYRGDRYEYTVTLDLDSAVGPYRSLA
jgi:GntR family transcriptional regulator